MKKQKYDLVLIYELNEDWSKHNTGFQELLGYSDASGAGFGERDMEWYDLSKDRADKMIKKAKDYAKKNKVKGFSVCKEKSEDEQ